MANYSKQVDIGGAYSVTFSGNTLSKVWHMLFKGSASASGLVASGTFKAERDYVNTANVVINATCNSKIGTVGGATGQYDYKIDVAVIYGGTTYATKNDYDTSNRYISGSASTLYSTTSSANGSDCTVTISNKSVEVKHSTGNLYLCYRCKQPRWLCNGLFWFFFICK